MVADPGSMPAPATASIEERDDLGTEADALVRFWWTQLKLAERTDEDWVARGRKVVARYRDDRPSSTMREVKYNILWSNTETLKPVLFGRTPNPEVRRRHTDNSEPAANLGAEILQRALIWEDDIEEFGDTMMAVVEDRLLCGRGVARVFYEARFSDDEELIEGKPPERRGGDQEADEDGGEDEGQGEEEDIEGSGEGQAEPLPASETPPPLAGGLGSLLAATRPPKEAAVISERAPVRYVFWEDYRECPARTEKEIWWKAYRSYLTREELVKRFGSEKGEKVNLTYTPSALVEPRGGPQNDAFKKAEVWEIWDKKEREAVWISAGYSEAALDRQDDPLELPGFFPSPPALRASTTNETRVPIADFVEYQDQAEELDSLTTRIDRLTRSLKVAGVYAGEHKATLAQLVDDGSENRLIPVEDWAAFADKGGLQGLISWLPVEQIATVLLQLYDARERILAIIYQTTGIADILRGETNPIETYGAQQLKSQFATRRISKQQKDVARFARDLMRLRGAVIARQFSPDTLELMSGLPEPLPALPPPPPMLIPNPVVAGQAMGMGLPGGGGPGPGAPAGGPGPMPGPTGGGVPAGGPAAPAAPGIG